MAKAKDSADSTAKQSGRQTRTLGAGLYIVATPIGNLGDITLRALETLKAADVVACEDTRVTAKLLHHYGIAAKTVSYHEHNAEAMRPKLMAEINAGRVVALVSDAGTPLVSDPGYRLVKEAVAAGLHVESLPGASSAVVALTLSGLPTDRFLFAGFLPPKEGAAREVLEELLPVRATLVFFESARRVGETLALMAEVFGAREAAVARELTKLYEEVRRSPLPALAAQYASQEPKGEIVIVVGPPAEEKVDAAVLDKHLRAALARTSLKEAVAEVALALRVPKNVVYARALAIKEEK